MSEGLETTEVTGPAVPSAEEEVARPRLGVVFGGDARDLRAWSGIPAGVSSAIASLGCDVVHVNADPPWPLTDVLINGAAFALAHRFGLSHAKAALRQARWQARATPAMARARQLWAGRRLGQTGLLGATIQIHGEYPIPGSRVVIYDDLTVIQALRFGYAEFERMSPGQARVRVESQRQAYVEAWACCATSRWAAESMVSDYGIPAAKVFVVGVGSNRTGSAIGRDWTRPRFLFVGKNWHRKNGDAVLRAFSQVRRCLPAAELHIVGGAPAGVGAGVTNHGSLRLEIPAERNKVDDLFRSSTCFVMPSLVEPSAIAYVEALAFGLPSIATSIGGSADFVGSSGVLVDPADDEALLAAMLRLCDPGVAARLGRLAASRAERFTWRAVAARLLATAGVPGFDAISPFPVHP